MRYLAPDAGRGCASAEPLGATLSLRGIEQFPDLVNGDVDRHAQIADDRHALIRFALRSALSALPQERAGTSFRPGRFRPLI